MENTKISFEQFNDPQFRRNEQLKVKTEAVWVAFIELNGLINISKFAKKYFNKSQSWFAQKLYGHKVCGKMREFSAQECNHIAYSLRDLAKKLNEYANLIDNAD